MPKNITLIARKKLHVFIADDDLDDIAFFKNALKEVTNEVKISVAKDGLELLEFLSIVQPDIIFLDINMPCMNGIDCLSEIRKLDNFHSVPVIIYSTISSEHEIDLTYDLGASMYFEKPAGFESIKSRLKDILNFRSIDLIPQLSRDKYFVKG